MDVNEINTPDACRREYGEAHDAHMALNGGCPWCGASDPSQGGMSVEDVERRHR